MGSILNQCGVVIRMNIASIPQRLLMSIATIIAVAVAVGVLLGLSGLSAGFRATLDGTGSDDVAIILRGNSQSELNSVVLRDQIRLIDAAPGLARDKDGKVLSSAELYIIVDGVKKSTGTKANLPFRGIEPNGLLLRKGVSIVKGRMFQPGSNEIVVGQSLLTQYSGFELNKKIRLGGNIWQIVGVFSAGGSAFESELWADTLVVQSQFNRGTSIQSLRVKLTSPAAFDALAKFLKADPRLNLEAKREKDYFRSQTGGTITLIRFIAAPLGIIMAIGALAGALNTMYSSVDARAQETATLRIIGFSGFAAFVGALAEALMLALLGAVVGVAFCFLFFDGATSSSLSQGFTQVVYAIKITPILLVQAAIMAIVIGVVGGVPPALRAANQSPRLALS